MPLTELSTVQNSYMRAALALGLSRRTKDPTHRVDELWCAVGRRGGKSRAMAVLAVYLAGLCDYADKLARGEKGIALLIAPDMKQAKVLLWSSTVMISRFARMR